MHEQLLGRVVAYFGEIAVAKLGVEGVSEAEVAAVRVSVSDAGVVDVTAVDGLGGMNVGDDDSAKATEGDDLEDDLDITEEDGFEDDNDVNVADEDDGDGGVVVC